MLGGGGLKTTLARAASLTVGEFAGDIVSRLAAKFGAGKFLTSSMKLSADQSLGVCRILAGIVALPLLRMARLPSIVTRDFSAVNVASGIIALTFPQRVQLLSKLKLTPAEIGLSDYETFMGLSDYQGGILSDYQIAGAGGGYSDGDLLGGDDAGILDSPSSGDPYSHFNG